ALLFFALIAFVFVPIGQMVGWYLENGSNGVLAYTINVLASLAGIILYTVLCFFYQPPVIWFLVAGALFLALLWKVPRLGIASAAVVALCAVILSAGAGKGSETYWSPYQKLTLTPLSEGGQVVKYELNTNDAWYQRIVNLSHEFVAAHPDLFRQVPIEWNPYNFPYRFYPAPPSVLVLGAGMGNDVAAAVRNGAGRVVAVEIDPLILDLGRRFHFEKPYDSARVLTVLDDARSYIENSKEQFDLIVFSLLDSHTTSSSYTNIRIDNYVYTLEALTRAQRLLRPDGLLIIKFQVNTPWIAGRLRSLLERVFGRPPLQMQGESGEDAATGGRFFIAGSQSRIDATVSSPQMLAFLRSQGGLDVEEAVLTTDDWPYFYQHQPGLPVNVIVISAAVVFMWWWFVHRTSPGGLSIRWQFFFLGAGFLLLETQIVSKMALLFGTT
ncbi:MAG: hypothetical protein DMG07_23205, partial [Acidobacteria bacterium]